VSRRSRPAFDRPLTVVEDPYACYVVAEDDSEDWLVRYEKDEDFPARAWASNMAATFNLRWRRWRDRDGAAD
jgi:hypothetical protein